MRRDPAAEVTADRSRRTDRGRRKMSVFGPSSLRIAPQTTGFSSVPIAVA